MEAGANYLSDEQDVHFLGVGKNFWLDKLQILWPTLKALPVPSGRMRFGSLMSTCCAKNKAQPGGGDLLVGAIVMQIKVPFQSRPPGSVRPLLSGSRRRTLS